MLIAHYTVMYRAKIAQDQEATALIVSYRQSKNHIKPFNIKWDNIVVGEASQRRNKGAAVLERSIGLSCSTM